MEDTHCLQKINTYIKIKHKIDGKINHYSRCDNCGLKMIETIDKEELVDLIKV